MPGVKDVTEEGLKDDEKLVYIAGPYTNGSWGDNIRNAIDTAQFVYQMGDVPFVPHTMTATWSIVYNNDWISFDLKWLEVCDYLIRLDGYSEGADSEVEFAKENGIKVFNGVWEYLEYIDYGSD